MNEKEFLEFLNQALSKGRTPQISRVIDDDDPQINSAGKFIGSHSLLPNDYDKIPIDKITQMGGLLVSKEAKISTKEAILVILAHHPSKEALRILKGYNKQPDEELKFFAQFALDECEMWNE